MMLPGKAWTVWLQLVTLSLLTTVGATQSLAKGLDELAEGNPENAENATSASSETNAETADDATQAPAEPATPSAVSVALAQKLSISTSFGWAKSSRAKGDWQASGMSDVAIGYKVLQINPEMKVDATYRYAPIAVSGKVDGHSYRGAWEAHYLGGRYTYTALPSLNVFGTVEAGYIVVSLDTTDALAPNPNHEVGGGSFAIGGGTDWLISDKWTFASGPRLYLGFGKFTTIQVGGGASFLF